MPVALPQQQCCTVGFPNQARKKRNLINKLHKIQHEYLSQSWKSLLYHKHLRAEDIVSKILERSDHVVHSISSTLINPFKKKGKRYKDLSQTCRKHLICNLKKGLKVGWESIFHLSNWQGEKKPWGQQWCEHAAVAGRRTEWPLWGPVWLYIVL